MSALWLASGSPRRRQLLEWAGFAVEVHPSHLPEHHTPGQDPVERARALAVDKARTGPADRVVLAADTVVHVGHRVFDKPADRAEATTHLRALSGRWHVVTTGVCVRGGGEEHVLHASTRMRFRDLATPEVAAYLATGEADDKAGAYGIQGRAGAFVAELRGSWTNVMGLPLEAALEALAACGAHPWT